MRKLATLILAAVFAASMFPAAFAADVSGFKDVSGHWGEAHLTKLIEAGVIAGDGRGNALPNNDIERYEAAIMLAKTFGIETLDLADAVTGNYTDITSESAYVEQYINNIIAAGFMVGGDGRFDPNRTIPRQDAFTSIRNAFHIPDAPAEYTSVFADFDAVAVWAQDHILAMEYAGMISGKNGAIAPEDSVTRAEFAALLSLCAGRFIDESADFDGAELERAIIRKPGLTVENLTAETLTIAQGVGDGDVTFENCDIGLLYVFGGGEHSISLINTSVTELVIDTAVTGNVRVFVDEDSVVELVKIYSEGASLDGDGEVITVEDYTDDNDGDNDEENDNEDDDAYQAAVSTVGASVTSIVRSEADGLTVTLTGELDHDGNIFLTRSASDFEAVVDAEGRPLGALLNGEYTAIEINVKEIMAALSFDLVDILQINPALAVYGEIGNISEDGGEWRKETFDRAPADFDDEFCVLVLGGEVATLLFSCGGEAFTLTVDATGLTVNGPAA